MDSFYDQPRMPPVAKSQPAEKIVPTLVPDASMLMQNHGNEPQNNNHMSYNAWRLQFKPPAPTKNKENINPPSIYKKQVRFESPRPQILQPIHENNPLPHRVAVNTQRGTLNPILQVKPFEKIYMANIPNRNLDLSLLEPPRVPINGDQINSNHLVQHNAQQPYRNINSMPVNQNKQNMQYQSPVLQNLENKSSKLLENQSAMLQTNKDNRQSSQAVNKIGFDWRYKEDSQIMLQAGDTNKVDYNGQKANHEPIMPKEFNNFQYHKPTAQIQGSNENYASLFAANNQGQIISKQSSIKSNFPAAESTTIEPKDPDEPTVKDLLKIIQKQNEQILCLQQQVGVLINEKKTHNYEPLFKEPKKNLPKFAFDVMTSFEVSIRPPNNFNNKKFGNNALKIQEIMEDSLTKPVDVSMTFDEPVVVREECPSPEHSIHVDMQDFSSESEEEEPQTSLLGWTIYNNVMDQVNGLLKNSKDNTCDAKLPGAAMRKVKEATIKQLKNVGVDLPNITENDSIASETSCSPTEISFAVKQLLMKYLPNDQLAKISNLNKPELQNYPKNRIRRRPDFSMATVQYMEKYNLLNKESGVKNVNNMQKRDKKMLDITALKQQPKLL